MEFLLGCLAISDIVAMLNFVSPGH